jgi:hypothetical protein
MICRVTSWSLLTFILSLTAQFVGASTWTVLTRASRRHPPFVHPGGWSFDSVAGSCLQDWRRARVVRVMRSMRRWTRTGTKQTRTSVMKCLHCVNATCTYSPRPGQTYCATSLCYGIIGLLRATGRCHPASSCEYSCDWSLDYQCYV